MIGFLSVIAVLLVTLITAVTSPRRPQTYQSTPQFKRYTPEEISFFRATRSIL